MQFVEHEILDNGVFVVRLNRPKLHNAFNDEMIEEIIQTFSMIKSKPNTRAVLFEAVGKSFCAGADLNWMKKMKDYSLAENVEDSKRLALMLKVIDECPCPVVAKVQGHALGGGTGLISVCDYAICSKQAKLGFTEVKLGLIPAVISPFVIAKIGLSFARALFLTGKRFDANTAKEIRLVHEVCEPNEIDEKAQSIINEILNAGPMAVCKAKSLIEQVITLPSASEIETYTCHAIANQRVSPEGQEGMQALLEKRSPQFE